MKLPRDAGHRRVGVGDDAPEEQRHHDAAVDVDLQGLDEPEGEVEEVRFVDPNVNLKKQLQLAVGLGSRIERGEPINFHDVAHLCELITLLDHWVTHGGALPKTWNNARILGELRAAAELDALRQLETMVRAAKASGVTTNHINTALAILDKAREP